MVDQDELTVVLDEFAATIAGEFVAEDILSQLARSACRVLDVDGAGVMRAHGEELLRFVFADGQRAESVRDVELLQEQLQDGPCRACVRDDEIVSVADLTHAEEWPAFQRLALDSGLRAVTAIPLRARDQTWGVLDLYRTSPRELDERELAAAQTLANLTTSCLVVTSDRDIARHAQELLAHRAMHDQLTGLPLRWVFLELLGHALTRLARRPGHVGVIFLDLDGLKDANDTYGHLAGDRLLQLCVERVRDAVRPEDVIARVGGDEFVVLLEDLATVDAGLAVAQRIVSQLSVEGGAGDLPVQPTASVGVALTADPHESADLLVAHADAAMYRAKRRNRTGSHYEVFDAADYAADRAETAASGRLTDDLRVVLEAGGHEQLELHYQPIVDVRENEADLYAVEALARWRHPTRGLLRAQDFVPTAERAGLLVELGEWVVRAACRQLARWDAALGQRAPRRMFVNVSVAELSQPGLPPLVADCLRENDIDPARLTLQITETGLPQNSVFVTRTVAELRQIGCQLAIDDFGSGYSSLSRLVRIPASTLKVDRSFTNDLRTSRDAVAVVSAVLLLGRTLGRDVIVEGVTDRPTLEALLALGCTYAQGHLLGRPQSADELAARIVSAV